jgi:hypothetical protein
MASYGNNFEFRVPPRSAARKGRYVAPTTALSGSGAGGGTSSFGSQPAGLLPIGAPVVADLVAGQDAQHRQYVKLAPSGTLVGTNGENSVSYGLAGIMVYEYGPAAFAGNDPYLTTYSDLGYAPLGAPVQVLSGDPTIKVVFRNTVAASFLGIRPYPGRTMVNGFGATATVTVGDYLIPGLGDDVDGYWTSTATAEGAWMVITGIDTTRLEVEAEMLF